MGVEAILRRARFAIAGTTDDARAPRELMARTRPYAGLFDVNLSEGDGIELAEAVLRDRPDQPTLLYAGSRRTRTSPTCALTSSIPVRISMARRLPRLTTPGILCGRGGTLARRPRER